MEKSKILGSQVLAFEICNDFEFCEITKPIQCIKNIYI